MNTFRIRREQPGTKKYIYQENGRSQDFFLSLAPIYIFDPISFPRRKKDGGSSFIFYSLSVLYGNTL
jgi:hypothetical protein